MSTFEYVSSGMSFSRILTKNILQSPEMIREFIGVFNKLKFDNHFYSALYNAHTEKAFGEMFKLYEGAFDNVYADSGGLQVITQGLDITQDLKNNVYNNQGRYSNLGMCFDEIPLSFTGTNSSRLDLSNRWFDKDSFEQCASQTGKNVNDQINTFKSINSGCKPIVIMQGNCYDTYMKWAELVYSNIEEDNKKYIGGVAMGAAALGHGSLEDIRRAVYYQMLPIDLPSNHVHLLAVGSVKRLLPNIIFSKNGFYKDDVHISYDSTTHTSAPHMGRYNAKYTKAVPLTRNFNNNHIKILNDIKDVFPEYDIDVNDYFKAITGNLESSKEMFKDEGETVVRAFVYTIAAIIYRFIETVNDLKNDVIGIDMFLKRKEFMPYNCLKEVKNYNDFLVWENHFKNKIDSKPVISDRPIFIDDMF